MSTEKKDVWRLSKTGHERLVEWHRANKEVEDLREKLKYAIQRLEQARNSLGGWLCPSDARDGETFNISIGDGFLQVQLEGHEPFAKYNVSWRVEPGPETLTNIY